MRRSETLHQTVDRVARGAADLLGEMGVELGGLGGGVAEVVQDEAQADAVFAQVRGVGVSERMDVSGEQPFGRAMGAPMIAEQVQGLVGQGNVAILAAFAVDVEQPAVAIDIGDLEASALEQAQATGVDGDQRGAVDRQAESTQDPLHLLAAEHDRELLLLRRTNQIPDRPGAPEGAFEKELDPAQRDGEAGTGEALHVGQLEEVLPQLFLSDPVRRPVEMRGELTDGMDVSLLGSGREPAELQVLDHALTEWRHGVPFLSGGRPAQIRMRRGVTPLLAKSSARSLTYPPKAD